MKLQTIIELKQSYISVIILNSIIFCSSNCHSNNWIIRIKKTKDEAKEEVSKTPTPTNDNPKKQSGGCFGIVILTFVAVSFFDAVVPQ